MSKVIGTNPLEATAALIEQAEYLAAMLKEDDLGHPTADYIARSARDLQSLLKAQKRSDEACARLAGE